MASRVNTQFVILLSAALVALVGCVGVFWFVYIHRDPQEMIQRGDQFMAEADYDAAIEHYGRALRRLPNDTALLNKYYAALQVAPVDSDLDAERYAGQLQNALRSISELRLADDAALERYYELLWTMARDHLASDAQLYQASDRRLQDDPDHVIARRYRGMAQTRRLSADSPREEQVQAREDLAFALAQRPDDAELIHHRVRWNLFEADRLDRPGGDREQAAALRAEARTLSQQMYDAQPQDRHRQLMHLQTLLDPGLDAADEARPLVDALEATLRDDPQPRHLVLAMIQLLPQMDRPAADVDVDAEADDEAEPDPNALPPGVRRARRLLDAAVAAHPAEAAYRLALGRYMAATGERDEALQQFARTRQMAREAPALDYLRWRQAGLEAGIQQADLLISQIPRTETDDARQALRQDVEAILAELTERVPEAPALRLLQGKLALLDGELGQAAIHFDQVSLAANQRHPDALRLAAHAHRRLGDWGAAAERLETLATLQPTRLATQVELADIYLAGGQLEQARQRLDAVLAQDPDHAPARRLQARLLAQSGDVEQALTAYQALDDVQDAALVAEQVRLYAAHDRTDEAVALLQRRLAVAPADLQAVQMRLALAAEDDDPALDAAALLDQAQQAGADPAALARLRRLQAGEPLTLDEAVDEALAAREDPLERALLQAQIARRQGDADAFRAALDDAEQHDRTHGQVIELQFELALADEAWDRARRYAELARDRNLDLADGDFYHGRLAAARGELRQSIGYFRRALTARPVYSQGHRFHGDALRQSGDHHEAVDAYRQAVEQRPNNVQALRGLAAAHDALGEHAEALRRLRQALQYQANDPALLEQYLRYEQTHGRREQALALRRQLAAAAPQQYENRRQLAALLATTGQSAEAIEQAQALLDDEGATPTNVALLAEVHRLAGDPAAGEAAIRHYLDQRGDAASAADYLLLGRYRLAIQDAAGMRAAYERAMALDEDPQQPATRAYADLLFERGLFQDAAPLYEQLHARFPDDATVALRLAETRIQMDAPAQARAILDRIPASAERLALEAILARLDGDPAQARAAIDQALARDDANALLYVERARIRLAAGESPAGAEADVSEALRRAPALTPARQLLVQLLLARGDTGSAKRELRTLLSHTPGHDQARLLLLELYLNDQQLRSAASLLADARALAPEADLWPRLQAQVAARQGEVEVAIGHWRQAVDRAATPGNVAGAAAYLLQQERADDALSLLAEHESALAGDARVRALQGQALAAVGRPDAAQRAFAAALAAAADPRQLGAVGAQMVRVWDVNSTLARLEAMADADVPPLKRQLAAAQVQAAAGQHAQAAQRLTALRPTLDPGDTALRQFVDQMLATAWHAAGDHDQARTVYRRMLEADPDHVAALNNLAYLLISVDDDPQQALPLAERAAAQAPGNASVLDTLGWAQYKVGRHAQARQTLGRALALQPLAPTYLHLGTLHAELQELDEARNLLGEAVRLAQQSGDAATQVQAQQLLDQLRPEQPEEPGGPRGPEQPGEPEDAGVTSNGSRDSR